MIYDLWPMCVQVYRPRGFRDMTKINVHVRLSKLLCRKRNFSKRYLNLSYHLMWGMSNSSIRSVRTCIQEGMRECSYSQGWCASAVQFNRQAAKYCHSHVFSGFGANIVWTVCVPICGCFLFFWTYTCSEIWLRNWSETDWIRPSF